MLRIIHTGRAYEVLDDDNCPGLLYTLERLRDMFATARLHDWKQRTLLKATERQLRATERKLESCQKSTLGIHGSRDPEALLDDLHSLNMQLMAEAWRLKDTHHVKEKS